MLISRCYMIILMQPKYIVLLRVTVMLQYVSLLLSRIRPMMILQRNHMEWI